MKWFKSLLIVMVSGMFVFAEPPKVVSENIESKVGDVVTFDVKVEKGKELGFQNAFANKDCMFVRLYSADPSEYSFLAQPKKAGTFTIVFWTVGDKTGTTLVITSAGVGPAPVPVPPVPIPVPPEPAPVFPDGRYKLSKMIYDSAIKNIPAGQERAKAATALAGSFESIASAIGAGAITDPEKILTQTTASNQTALSNAGITKSVWEPVFKELQTVTFALNQQEKMVTRFDFKDAWGEIAAGLKAVK